MEWLEDLPREHAIVKSGQNKSLNKELCCMFPEKGPGAGFTKIFLRNKLRNV